MFLCISCASHNKVYLDKNGGFIHGSIDNLRFKDYSSSDINKKECVQIDFQLHSRSQRVVEEQKELIRSSFLHIGMAIGEKGNKDCYFSTVKTYFIPYIDDHGFIVTINDEEGNKVVEASNKSKVWTSYPKELYNPVFWRIQKWYNGQI